MNRLGIAGAAAVVGLLAAGCNGNATSGASPDGGAGSAGPGRTALSTASVSATSSPARTTATPSSTSTTTAGTTTGTTAAAGPRGGPVPKGFRPQSVTFVSAADGWVLGTAPCSNAVCTSVVRTTDGGRSWTGIPAPVEALGSRPGPGQGSGLTTLRFANTRDGYAFGDHLWLTTDGGGRWARRQLPGAGRIVALAASAGRVYLLLAPPGGSSGTAALYRAPAGSTRWTRVFHTSLGRGQTLRLAVHGQRVWLLVGGAPGSGTVYRSGDAGAHWTHAAAPCQGRFLPAGLGVAPNGSYVALACTGNGAAGSVSKHVYVSTDAGGRFAPTAGDPSRLGDSAHVAVPSAGAIVVGSASAATVLDASFDGGAHWATVFRSDTGGQPLHDLGFTTRQQGVVVEGVAAQPRQPSQLYLTRDGGHHWSAVTF